MTTHLIAGLGNPGPDYSATRHNIGFMAVDAIAAHYKLPGWKKKFRAEITAAPDFILIKPQTMMNLSGEAVGDVMRFHKLDAANVIVFHDDLDLQPGQVKIKQGGGPAGHNGLKSIDAHIGPDYWRVRLGIGHPRSLAPTGAEESAVLNYVLGAFPKIDHKWLDPLLTALAENFDLLLKGKTAEYLNQISPKE